MKVHVRIFLSQVLIASPVLGAAILGTDIFSDQLVSINTSTGTSTIVGSLGFDFVSGLAYDAQSDVLYGADKATDQLITISATTGAGSAVGSFGHEVVTLAFNQNTNTLWGLTTTDLVTIDTTTGAATSVGATGITVDATGTTIAETRGLEWDPISGKLYATVRATNLLFTLNPLNGSGSQVGELGFSDVNGLAYDPTSNTMYGATSFGTDQLLIIDPVTGSATAVGPTSTRIIRGLTFYPIPEPSSALLLLTAFASSIFMRRRSAN